MLIAEMFNTSIEALCDFVETVDNDKIRILKDISAAATYRHFVMVCCHCSCI